MERSSNVVFTLLGRWLAVAGILLAGLVLFFLFAPETEPVVSTFREAAGR